jgi:hypothetical protein
VCDTPSDPQWADCVEKLGWQLGRADFVEIAKTLIVQIQ